jgi:hypothetical protein
MVGDATPRERRRTRMQRLPFDAVRNLGYTEGVARRVLPALACLALVLGLVACGGVARTLDPVAEAASKSADAGSVRVSIDASFAADGMSGAITADGIFDQDKGELTIDASNLLGQLNLPGAPTGIGEVKVLSVTEDGHPAVYVNLPALAGVLPGGVTWIKADVDQAASAAGGELGQLLGLSGTSPAKLLDLLRGAGSVVKVGSDSIDGAPVTHYRATVDLVRALEQEGVPAEAVQALVASGASTELPVDVWTGDADGYIHRIAVAYDATVAGKQISAKASMTMSDWGTDVSIDVPPADQVFDATALAAQLGKLQSGGSLPGGLLPGTGS